MGGNLLKPSRCGSEQSRRCRFVLLICRVRGACACCSTAHLICLRFLRSRRMLVVPRAPIALSFVFLGSRVSHLGRVWIHVIYSASGVVAATPAAYVWDKPSYSQRCRARRRLV
ncbi:hypothetical protein R3P38DRAFT_549420 [Favolaschia claudopus]|uniref:Uncharacterized protein n=1 Tax=Favolaschia claudopus TaxID=2862362 RepID=A0AAV9ZAR8_9AGAR